MNNNKKTFFVKLRLAVYVYLVDHMIFNCSRFGNDSELSNLHVLCNTETFQLN